MSSFKDQLYQAGLISKKQLRKINQEEKIERKRKQGNKRKKLVEQAEARAQAKEEKEARMVVIRAERAKREEATMQALQKRKVQQLLSHHRQRYRTADHPFWHCTIDGQHVHKLWVPSRIAWELRSGAMAIAAIGNIQSSYFEYIVISREVARRVQEIEPERVVFLNEHPPDKDDPAERLYGTD